MVEEGDGGVLRVNPEGAPFEDEGVGKNAQAHPGYAGPGTSQGAWGGRDESIGLSAQGDRLDTLAPLPATVVCGRAEDMPTPPDCSRVLCYIDVPYLGECDEAGTPSNPTTGYAHEFPRPAVRAVAARWHRAGAHVVISECADLSAEMERETGERWYSTDIADARIGQRRTFSRQQREVLTSNRPLVPRHAWPSRGSDPRQGGLFG